MPDINDIAPSATSSKAAPKRGERFVVDAHEDRSDGGQSDEGKVLVGNRRRREMPRICRLEASGEGHRRGEDQ